ncbi:LAETG motif-containing sortase-dependent surface protein [Streptomyces sp. NPDC016845]|uniref:LAETG motif-containing sortase-dependent surface protein n=1 Tax=Streptomyces sp. NPDC016845 TaxID=3364972 RepID=UPI0037AAB380
MSAAVVARRAVVGGAAAVCLVVAGGSGAWAHGTPGGEGWGRQDVRAYTAKDAIPAKDTSGDCEFSLDGKVWAAAVKVDDLSLKPGADGKVHLQVRPAQSSGGCTVSLASYRTHGATWNTSGLQVFHDFDTVTVKSGDSGSLDIAVPDAGCYAQVDLYRGSVKYDGLTDANDGLVHGDLPQGPDRAVIKEKNVAWWNGGTRDCTTETETSSPSPSTSTPAEDEPAPATSTPAAPDSQSATPSASATPATATSTTAAADAPAASPSTSAPAADGDLAQTGSSGNTTAIAGSAAALLAIGGGVLVVLRRRNANGRG